MKKTILEKITRTTHTLETSVFCKICDKELPLYDWCVKCESTGYRRKLHENNIAIQGVIDRLI